MSDKHVIFGSGPLAQATMRALHKRGKQVRMINRSGQRPANVPAEIEIVAGDARSSEFTRSVTTGAAVIYQCAQPRYHEWTAEFPPLQAAIMDAAVANGAKLIVGENTYMYGDTNGQSLHENLPYAAKTRKGLVRAKMAESLLEAHRLNKVKVAIARGSDFFGPGVINSSLGARTLVPIFKGKPAEATGSLDMLHTYTFIDDFGEALAILGERDDALGQVWHVPNAETLTQRQLLTLFFQQAGFPPKFSVMGKTMLWFGGLFVPEAKEMVEMIYEFNKPFIVDSSKFIKTFGDISTPYRSSIPETINWYRKYLDLGA